MQTAEINSIDTTLRELAPLVTDVQRSLETGLDEGGSGAESVAAVVQPLATIRGTLELLDLHGAAALVREMGEIGAAVAGDRIGEAEQAMESLLEAVLRLPDYLDRIRAGQRDAPVVLLPLINQLRALHGAEALDERALFFPPLPVFGAAEGSDADERLQQAAQRLRGRFQRALLGWYRSSDGDQLAELAAVLQELADHSSQSAAQQLWEVGGAFAESLADDGREIDGRIKGLMARLERLIADVARGGETALAQAEPAELLRGLLYHLARTGSERPAVRDVRQAYQLEQLLPDGGSATGFEGPNRELLDAVGAGIRSDLAQIKDAVEIYVHSEERRADVLGGLPDRLKQIADTFSMLGLSDGHAKLRAEAEVLAGVEALSPQEAEPRLQSLADELLRAEGELARLQSGHAQSQAEGREDGAAPLAIRDLPDSEYQSLLAAVVAASLENLSKVREAIGVFCSDPEPDPETVSEVPTLLAEIEGAASLLPLDRAQPLLGGLREYAEQELARAGRKPDDHAQILIADVVAGLEYYLEAVAHDRASMTHLLEGAVRALDALRTGGTPQIYDEDEEVILEAPAGESGIEDGGLSWEDDLSAAGDDPDEDELSLKPIDHDISLSSEPELGGEPEPDPSSSAALDFAVGEGAADRAEEGAGGADADDAALPPLEADFAEGGADPETGEADETFPALAPDTTSERSADAPVDESPVAAWDTDRPEPGSPAAVEAPADESPQADETFPSLAPEAMPERSADGPADESPCMAVSETDRAEPSLSTAADAPDDASPLAPETEAPAAPDATAHEPEATDAVASGSGSRFAIVSDDVDEDVVEVYIEEALGELDKINEHLPRWKANPTDEEAVTVVRRAYHTLKGGGRLIGAELLGEFSWSMESLLNRVIGGSVKPSSAVYETLDEASAALPQLVEQIQGNQAPIDGVDDLIARAHALSRGETPPVPAPSIGAAPAPATAASESEPSSPADEEEARRSPAPGETPPSEPSPAAAGSGERLRASEPSDPAPEGAAAAGSKAQDRSAQAQATATEESAAGPDRTLLEIFQREAESHQDVLRNAFAGAQEAPQETPIAEAVSRAIHTLVGSSQTAGVEAIAELSGAMEAIVRARREQRGVLEAEDVALFGEAVAAIDRVLADLPELGRAETASTRERLEAQRQRAAEASASAEEQGDNELLDVFLGEGDELLEQCDRAVAAWRQQPEARTPIGELQRALHTLKGGARMAGLMPIADLTHELESVINGVEAAGTVPQDSAFELLQEAVDALTILMEQARAQQPIARVDWLIDDLRSLQEQAEGGPSPAGEHDGTASAARPEADAAAEPPAGGDAGATEGSETSPAGNPGPGGETAGPAPEPRGAGDQSAAVPEAPSTPAQNPSAAIGPEGAERSAPDTGAGNARATAPGSEPAGPPDEPGATGAKAAQPGSEQVRVQAEVLDNLVNFAGEVSIYHSRLNEQMGQYRFNLNEFEQTVSRLRNQLRTMEDETESQILHRSQSLSEASEIDPDAAEFDPLEFDRYTRLQELSRSLSESIGDLDSLKEILETVTRDAETLLLQQSRVSSELQDGLMQTRMVRFDGLRGRLARVVRQTAGQLGRKAQLTLTGGELELDRSVQERIVAPLEHLLRNAVAHGIESPEERERRGKPTQGAVQLDLHRGGTDVVIEITDDGRGIDPEAVRRRAVERGLIAPNDERDDSEIIRLVLETGFSTAEEVTQISGRGVGMDVVDAEIRRLGGTLGIHTEVGRGTRFTVRLPVTLAINQAVLVETGDDTYAIPIASVEGVSQVTAANLKAHYVDSSKPFVYGGTEYRLEHLGRLLGTAEPRLDNPDVTNPVIMIRAGDERVALHVEQLVGRRDVVVKPLGAPVNELAGLSGATIMPDGRVILILDIGGLLRTESRFVATGGEEIEAPERAAAAPAESETEAEAETSGPAPGASTVLVVDDSITIRKVTQRILERNGFHVVTAKDGIDALSWMAHSVPDLILLDIEMPRMDGYEVATYVRGEERLAQAPIVMITSRTGDKHRDRAEEIGVNRYLGKPYQETELMEHIEQLLRAPAAV